ncbi:39S mitochondrial ribosomal protein L46-domain-containing protein [Schizothecium vesticola]|uniref:Large ribosomal subunit protein mL46 n=1 Tax=Schizothecium vesticola TaxID=314040 RepID=A0AA40KBK9_9PEZI|nr:39S mitochondrial ribosomal protein L46-domain-containing protein [Schizothecium vesticola]
MSAASRGGNGAVSALLRNSRRVCSHCARPPTSSLARPYSEAATTPKTTPTPPEDIPSTRYRIKAGLILSRPPLLTRAPTPFESAFYLYQKRLNERLAAPFRAPLYFPTDTARALDWRLKQRERHGVAAKDIGRYNPRGRVAWNDEVLVGSATSTPEYVVERLLADAEVRVSEDGEEISAEERVPVERPVGRRSRADEEGDVRRLDRRMEETVYLVVRKGEEGEWGFPAGDVTTSEALHETAKRTLAESAGVNMNAWIVGRVPIAHHVAEFEDAPETGPAPAAKAADAGDESRFDGEKIFFLKGRIMAGQVDLTGNKYGYTDFKWVNKDELRQTLPYEYWRSVRNMVELR